MTDAEYEAQKTRVEALIHKWHEILGLYHWRFRHEFYRQDFPAPEAAAQTTVRWDYGFARFDWNLPDFAGMDDDECEHAVVHEYMHVLVNEMRPCNQKVWERCHEERVVTNLALAARWALEAGQQQSPADALRWNG